MSAQLAFELEPDAVGPWVLGANGWIIRGLPGDPPWCPDYWAGASPELRHIGPGTEL